MACRNFYNILYLGSINLFQGNISFVIRSSESDYGHLWWYKFVLYYWLLPATTFQIVFAAVRMQGAY